MVVNAVSIARKKMVQHVKHELCKVLMVKRWSAVFQTVDSVWEETGNSLQGF